MSEETLDPEVKTLAETDRFIAWQAVEPDGETTYHLEFNNVTVHFFVEEWEEFLVLVEALVQ
jgi:hypothetical protein